MPSPRPSRPWHIAHWLLNTVRASVGPSCRIGARWEPTGCPGPDSCDRSAPELGGGGVSPLPQAAIIRTRVAGKQRMTKLYHSAGSAAGPGDASALDPD